MSEVVKESLPEALIKIQKYLDKIILKKDKPVLLAIDGKSGSGKTTLAEELARQYQAELYHMDDFFLQPFQRTLERLAEIGGNVDYKRFQEEVLLPILENREFSYGIFNCKEQKIIEYKRAGRAKLHIIEGAYSAHPYFGNPYDFIVCLDIDKEIQKERIRVRNGEGMVKRFVEEWIPKENAYLEKFHIMELANLCIQV